MEGKEKQEKGICLYLIYTGGVNKEVSRSFVSSCSSPSPSFSQRFPRMENGEASAKATMTSSAT